MAKKKEIDEEVDSINEEVIDEKKERFIIEEPDFKMISSFANNIRFFDLYFLHTINKGKPTEKKEFKLEGYGYTLKTAIRKIVIQRSGYMPKKHFSSFKEFVSEYIKLAEEVKALFAILPSKEE